MILVLSKSSTTSTHDGLIATIGLFMTYSASNAAFAYLLSFCFKSAPSAQRAMILINVLAICLTIVSFIMGRSSEVCNIDEDLNLVLRLIPHYAWGNGLLKASANAELS